MLEYDIEINFPKNCDLRKDKITPPDCLAKGDLSV